MELERYYLEFMTIAIAHLIAVASPGPDFAVVLKNSIKYGRKTALITSVGVGTAILIHVAYALAGIGLVINSTPWLYDVLIVVAAAFLIYIGSGAVRSPKPEINSVGGLGSAIDANSSDTTQIQNEQITSRKAFVIGFMTNGLNPKATLFFLSLFTVVISADTPMLVQGVYGVYLALATTAWFCSLSLLLSHKRVRAMFSEKGYLFDRIMGWVLILLAVHILTSEFLF
ncbi:LysE family transporter [Psychrosphaera ytuae]|uniref:LysE family transporter n=1 Tax=Psychrosphaera ytuae TaxID=2820710 RepID=A0A975DBU9_9GAMM|nr:LysE family transporter [Psychrosphaera ytuae]QTH64277.1 LysE family transporter [Psychrosphaera ytuae]